jgi:hypothetical protein
MRGVGEVDAITTRFQVVFRHSLTSQYRFDRLIADFNSFRDSGRSYGHIAEFQARILVESVALRGIVIDDHTVGGGT